MTAKEKAKELVDKFLNEQNNTEEISEAKQCALICVDEVLDAVISIADKKYEFYTEVKQEINKL